MVIEPWKPHDDFIMAHDKKTLNNIDKEAIERGEKYLNQIPSRLIQKGIPVNTKIIVGKPDDEIVGYIENNDYDLLIMSSHGRSGVSRWVLGSVADKVFRNVCISIVMICALKCGELIAEK